MMADDPAGALPPPYARNDDNANAPTMPTTTTNTTSNPIQATHVINFRRSLTDTREQIHSNLRILKMPTAEIITTRMTRSQFLHQSNLKAVLHPELDGPPPAPSDAQQAAQTGELLRVAMVATRSPKGAPAVDVAVRSRACVTLEDAMESLLERVEILVLQILIRHGSLAAEPLMCCYWCKRMMSRAQVGSFAPEAT